MIFKKIYNPTPTHHPPQPQPLHAMLRDFKGVDEGNLTQHSSSQPVLIPSSFYGAGFGEVGMRLAHNGGGTLCRYPKQDMKSICRSTKHRYATCRIPQASARWRSARVPPAAAPRAQCATCGFGRTRPRHEVPAQP